MQKKLKKVSFNSKFDKVIKFILVIVLLSFIFSGVLERTCILICCAFATYISVKNNYATNVNLKSDIKGFVYLNNLIEYEKDGKIIYVPSIYYFTDNNSIILQFIIEGSKKSLAYLEYKEQLEHLLKLTCSDVKIVKGAVTYTFSKVRVTQAVDSELKEIKMGDNEILISDSLIWNYRKNPHGLIIGLTNSGKTYFLSYLVLSLLRNKSTIKIIDPKRSDMSYLKRYLNDDVQYENNQILKTLRIAVEEMNRRYEVMTTSQDYKFGADFSYYGIKPYFILFDELACFVATLDKKQLDECNKYLFNLVLKGRQSGINVVLLMQRPDSDFLKTAIRDQLGLRIALGNLSTSGYKMIFGDDGKEINLELSQKGAGFCFLDGTTRTPKEFIAPFLDLDFIQEVEKLTKVDIVKVDITKTTDSLDVQNIVTA